MTYRKPWTGGAKAYPQADTLADIRQSMVRKRNSYSIHVTAATPEIAAIPCARCGVSVALPGEQETKTPEHAVVTVYPKTRTAVFAHYTCSWSMLFEQIAAIHL